MKGLLRKDFTLLLQNRSYLMLLAVILLVMSFSLEGPFLAAYSVMICAMLGLSTLNADQAEGTMSFLFTLPVSRRLYVREKFLFCLLLCAAGLGVGIGLLAAKSLVLHQPELLGQGLPFLAGFFPAMAVMTCVLLAIQLRFGPERSRVILLLFYGGIAALAVGLNKVLPGSDALAGVKAVLDALPPAVLPLGVFVLCTGLCLLCCHISERWILRKEF